MSDPQAEPQADPQAYTMNERIVARTIAAGIAVNMPQVPHEVCERAAQAAIDTIRGSVRS